MNWEFVAFVALALNQVISATIAIAVYVWRSDWRRSPVGRHLLYWPAASGIVDLSWLLLVLVRWPWLAYVLFAAQTATGLLTWQRVRLVLRAQRGSSGDQSEVGKK